MANKDDSIKITVDLQIHPSTTYKCSFHLHWSQIFTVMILFVDKMFHDCLSRCRCRLSINQFYALLDYLRQITLIQINSTYCDISTIEVEFCGAMIIIPLIGFISYLNIEKKHSILYFVVDLGQTVGKW